MPYDRLMVPHPSLPADLWERTPREVQDYMLALEARVAALEATVQELIERVQQDWTRARRRVRPRVIRPSLSDCVASPVAGALVDHLVIRGRPGRGCPWKTWMW